VALRRVSFTGTYEGAELNLDPRLEDWRHQHPPSPTGASYGLFHIPFRSATLKVICCDGRETGWDHVSVSLPNRVPNWEEMCFVKDLFFDEGETVVQFHPKASEYVNNCGTCLHLWRPVSREVELPPRILV